MFPFEFFIIFHEFWFILWSPVFHAAKAWNGSMKSSVVAFFGKIYKWMFRGVLLYYRSNRIRQKWAPWSTWTDSARFHEEPIRLTFAPGLWYNYLLALNTTFSPKKGPGERSRLIKLQKVLLSKIILFSPKTEQNKALFQINKK